MALKPSEEASSYTSSGTKKSQRPARPHRLHTFNLLSLYKVNSNKQRTGPVKIVRPSLRPSKMSWRVTGALRLASWHRCYPPGLLAGLHEPGILFILTGSCPLLSVMSLPFLLCLRVSYTWIPAQGDVGKAFF